LKTSWGQTVCLVAGLVLGAGACKGGGDGGGGGSGGSGGGGSGGNNQPANCPSHFPDDLISDFTQDNSLAGVNGRQGGWYTYGDPMGHFAVASTGYDIDFMGNSPCSGSGALHVKGTGFAEWGAAMGADFRPRKQDGDGGSHGLLPVCGAILAARASGACFCGRRRCGRALP